MTEFFLILVLGASVSIPLWLVLIFEHCHDARRRRIRRNRHRLAAVDHVLANERAALNQVAEGWRSVEVKRADP
jgi:hypothetical protein